MIRLFTPEPIGPAAEITPSNDQCHYLLSVMRLGLGEPLLLFNGRDGEWLARVSQVSRRQCRLHVETMTRAQTPPAALELIIALVKRGRLETIVEKAAELGVGRVQLVTTRRTNVEHVKMARLQAIATEAAEQTGRLDVPVIEGPTSLSARLDAWEVRRRLLYCDEAGEDPEAQWGGPTGRAAPILEALSQTHDEITGPEAWSVLIGPEGGFEPEERRRLRGCIFVTPVTLGPRILRADTAAISALTLWQAVLGDWRESAAALAQQPG